MVTVYNTGWLSPGSGTSVSAGTGTRWWDYPSRITTDQGNCTYANSATSDPAKSGGVTQYLRASNYGANVPTGATIVGLEVRIRRNYSGTATGPRDHLLRVFNGSSLVGDNKASSSNWNSGCTLVSYGSASDGWGASLTPSMVNNTNFGVYFQAKNYSSAYVFTLYVDVIQIRVSYTTVQTYTSTHNCSALATCGVSTQFIPGNGVYVQVPSALVNINQCGKGYNLLDNETSLTLNISKFAAAEATPHIVDSPDGSGEQVLEIKPTAGGNVWSMGILNPANLVTSYGITGGDVYTFSSEIFIPTAHGLNSDWNEGLRLGCRYIIGANPQQFAYGNKATKLGEWEEVYHTFYVPAGATTVQPRLCNGFTDPSKSVYFRRLKIQSRNLCTPNQATGTDTLQNTTGFGVNDATMSSSAEWSSEGTRSLKITTSGPNGRGGPRIPRGSIEKNVEYNWSMDFKGEAGKTYRVQMYHASSPWTLLREYSSFVATGDAQTLSGVVTFDDTLISGNDILLYVRQTVGDAGVFYLDKLMFLNPIMSFAPNSFKVTGGALTNSPSAEVLIGSENPTVEAYDAFIGPLMLNIVTLVDGLKATIKDGIISSNYRGSGFIGKKNEPAESRSLKFYVPSSMDLSMMGLSEIDEFVPLDASMLVEKNSALVPKGYAFISSVGCEYVNPSITEVTLEPTFLTRNTDPLFTFDYTKGVFDGTQLITDYKAVNLNFSVSMGDWSTYSSDFNPYYSSGLTSPNLSVSGGKLVASGNVDTAGNYGYLTSSHEDRFTPPLFVEADMYRDATKPATNAVGTGFVIGNKDFGVTVDSGDVEGMDQIRCRLVHDSSKTSLVVDLYESGSYTTLHSSNLGASVVNCKVKAFVDKEMNLTVWYNTGGNDVQVLNNVQTRMGSLEDLYVGLYSDSTLDVSYTRGFNDFSLWYFSYDEISTGAKHNVICAPITSNISPSPTFYRESRYGAVPCYVNPSGRAIEFNIPAAKFYDGAVKVYDDHRLVLSKDYVFSDTLTLKNGVTKLVVDKNDSTISLFGYYGGWQLINTFSVGDIREMKVSKLSSDETTVKINNTYWNLKRGKPSLLISHPTTDITYVAKQRYYHDDGYGSAKEETIIGSNKDVRMLDVFYCNVYNLTEEYRLQILKTKKQTIKNDKIPADNVTGLGWYFKNSTGYEHNAYRAKEWMYQPDTKILP